MRTRILRYIKKHTFSLAFDQTILSEVETINTASITSNRFAESAVA